MTRAILTAVIGFTLAGCMDEPSREQRLLETLGYSGIEFRARRSCGFFRDDGHGFVAISPDGKAVTGRRLREPATSREDRQVTDETFETFYSRVPIRAWVRGVGAVEEQARQQLFNTALIKVVAESGVAAMPDVHYGIGATVGSVVPTVKAIIPACVGVDIGCGVVAAQTQLVAADLDDKLPAIRAAIENAIPIGGPGIRGSWSEQRFRRVPREIQKLWDDELAAGYAAIVAKHPKIKGAEVEQLGTLGTGNHFQEVCLDESGSVWIMLHSGSRGVGNRIGTYFIGRASEEHASRGSRLPDRDLAWLDEGTQSFDDYVEAVGWAQAYARLNRDAMLAIIVESLRKCLGRPVEAKTLVVNCHHNYVQRETHFGQEVWLTRKGAVSAKAGQLGVIPGSMGTRSYIVEGLGNPLSYESCSHGAGRRMSRGAAKKAFTTEDHVRATVGVECRKDAGVLDETPGAYKDIDAVMEAQRDLVRPMHTLKAVVCVKG